jgi:hypothetical protein
MKGTKVRPHLHAESRCDFLLRVTIAFIPRGPRSPAAALPPALMHLGAPLHTHQQTGCASQDGLSRTPSPSASASAALRLLRAFVLPFLSPVSRCSLSHSLAHSLLWHKRANLDHLPHHHHPALLCINHVPFLSIPLASSAQLSSPRDTLRSISGVTVVVCLSGFLFCFFIRFKDKISHVFLGGRGDGRLGSVRGLVPPRSCRCAGDACAWAWA